MKALLATAICLALFLGPATLIFAREERILIAYFSWSGNTKKIAEEIHQKVGGDLFEIVPVKLYSRDYKTCLDEAAEDQKNQARPELTARVPDMAKYEVIYLGYPNWWAGIPMPVASFLEQYDFEGRTIVPFCSHGGGRLGQSVNDIAKSAPQANILEALAISSGGGRSLSGDIDAWLARTGRGE